jgi:hypothetical protein
MSGIAKGIKKVFKAVGKVIKKIAKPLLVAAAIYFTAGVALAAFPATAGFAAAMPGFAGAAGAGTGILSKVAIKFGLGSIGSTGGIAAQAAASAAGATVGGIAAGTSIAGAQAATNTALIQSGVSTGLAVPAAQAGGSAAGLVAKTGAAAAGKMSVADKLLLASTAMNTIGALKQPSQKDIIAAQKRWEGAFYGADSAGNTAGLPPKPPMAPGARLSPQTAPQGASRQLITPTEPDATESTEAIRPRLI